MLNRRNLAFIHNRFQLESCQTQHEKTFSEIKIDFTLWVFKKNLK